MKKTGKVLEILRERYEVKPWRGKPFEVLLTTILSQRTKDETTREVSKRLLKVANSPSKILKMSTRELEKLIKPAGFYKQKARRIKKICKILVEKYKGKVPEEFEELIKLPGVGDKTASCVLVYGFGKSFIPVDTHVNRVSRRIGWVPPNSTPSQTRKILEKIVSKRYVPIVNFLLIQFGKDICKPINPRCNICPIRIYCRTGKLLSK